MLVVALLIYEGLRVFTHEESVIKRTSAHTLLMKHTANPGLELNGALWSISS